MGLISDIHLASRSRRAAPSPNMSLILLTSNRAVHAAEAGREVEKRGSLTSLSMSKAPHPCDTYRQGNCNSQDQGKLYSLADPIASQV